MHPPSLRVLMLQRLLPALEARGIGAPDPCPAPWSRLGQGDALTSTEYGACTWYRHGCRGTKNRHSDARRVDNTTTEFPDALISRASLASTCIFLRPSKSVPDLVPQCFYPLSPSTPDPLDKAVEEDDLSILIPCLKVPFSFSALLFLIIVLKSSSIPALSPRIPLLPFSSAPLRCR